MFHKMRNKATEMSLEISNNFLILKLKGFFQGNLGMAVGRRLACPESGQMVPAWASPALSKVHPDEQYDYGVLFAWGKEKGFPPLSFTDAF